MKQAYIFKVKGKQWRIVAHSYEIAYMILKVLTHSTCNHLDYSKTVKAG